MAPRPVLLPLGTGAGATTVLHGDPSSSFAILVGGECRLLVDLGYGIARQCLRLLESIPPRVYISHNHSDHAGDLPVVAMASAHHGKPLTIWSEPEVARRLKAHRLAEFHEAGALPEELANWIETPAGVETSIDQDLSLIPYKGQHSESCFGFVLRFQGEAVLGYSADSGYSRELYDHLLAAPLLVLDARLEGSPNHAGFDEVEAFAATVPGKKIWVTHYGRPDQAPARLPHLRPGEPLDL